MKKTFKAATLALALSILAPTFVYAAPRPADSRGDGDNVVVRAVKSIKKLIVKALEGPMIPPPTNSDGH